jgi:hypothetical protein
MDNGVQFWGQALGYAIRSTEGADNPYVELTSPSGGLQVNLQRIGSQSRFHLDIETDNVEAEVERLEKLGARRQEQVNDWWAMEAPSGHAFCVVPAPSHNALAQATAWET